MQASSETIGNRRENHSSGLLANGLSFPLRHYGIDQEGYDLIEAPFSKALFSVCSYLEAPDCDRYFLDGYPTTILHSGLATSVEIAPVISWLEPKEFESRDPELCMRLTERRKSAWSESMAAAVLHETSTALSSHCFYIGGAIDLTANQVFFTDYEFDSMEMACEAAVIMSEELLQRLSHPRRSRSQPMYELSPNG